MNFCWMIEIIKTTISNANEPHIAISHLKRAFSNAKFNIDLNDNDKVLRMECLTIQKRDIEVVISILTRERFTCEIIS